MICFLSKHFFRAGFVGMRGKKGNIEGDKRAGFVGMRGKKGEWPEFIGKTFFHHLKMRQAYCLELKIYLHLKILFKYVFLLLSGGEILDL